MAECDELIHKLNKRTREIFLGIPEEYQKTVDWLDNYRKEIRIKIKEARSENYNRPILPKTPSRHKQSKRPAIASSTSEGEDHSSSKVENKSTNITRSLSIASGKPKRNASKLAEQKINVQAHQDLRSKMRRPEIDTALSDVSNNTNILNIKSEKKSTSPIKPLSQIGLNVDPENVKKENMPPPPAYKPKKGRKKIKKEVETFDTETEGIRVTRSKKTAKTSSTKKSRDRKNSDVILQEVSVPVIIINDSDTEDVKSQLNSEVENNIEDSQEDVLLINTKTRKKTKKQPETKSCKVNIETIALDTTRVIHKDEKTLSLNHTHLIEKAVPSLNETHVIPKDNETSLKTQNGITMNCAVVLHRMNETISLPKNHIITDKTIVLTPRENDHQWEKADVNLLIDNLLTDDEESILKATPEKKPEPVRKGIKTKQMFSPYSNSPVRKRVAAFEKLVINDAVVIPTTVTRTKTKNIEKENQGQSSSESTVARITSTKSKYFTPTLVKKLPSLIPHSDTKAYRQGTVGKNTLATKSASTIKPSKIELQLRREEDQKKKLEKEEEARRKREAIMHAKAEEQRKKREEKQMKAQKAREELEREKEEKLRQMLQEKEEEQQKKREWQTKKLAMIEETKKAEELNKLLKLRHHERQQQLEEKRKKQLATKPPPLPTYDCEDSDSSSETPVVKKKVYQKPEWAQSQYLSRTLMIQKYIHKTVIETLYKMEATTPDLLEIFETVDERILRRNSSAVWCTPPRYSTLPKF